MRWLKAAAAAAMTAAWVAAPGDAQGAPLPVNGTLDLTADAEVRLELPNIRGTQAATTVAPAGDVNGDGLGDAIIGARGLDARGRATAGSAFVVFGRSTPAKVTVDLENLGAGGFRIDGHVTGDRAGFNVNRAGDVNGDGFGDVLVGAPYANSDVGEDNGAAYVVFGGPGAAPVDLANPGDRSLRITGANAGDHLGWAVSGVGDQDGDGRADVLVGAPGFGDDGAAYLITDVGSAGERFVGTDSLSQRTVRYTGSGPGRAGWSVGTSTDMTGDGVQELLFGAPNLTKEGGLKGIGHAFIVFGKRSDPGGQVDLSQVGGGGLTVVGEIEPAPSGDGAGNYVIGLGDVNGDGRGDVGVSAHFSDPGKKVGAGSMFVVYGGPEGGSIKLAELGARGARVDGANPGDEGGHSFAPVGDFNADGTQDTAIMSLRSSPLSREQAGATSVIFGNPAGGLDLSATGEKGIRLAGGTRMDHHGTKVAGLGDFTGDGTPDILVGGMLDSPKADAPGQTNGHSPIGYIVSGVKPVPPPVPDPGQVEEVQLDGCKSVTNVEIVVDDSGSMSETDPTRLRKQAIELLLAKPRSVGRVIGAVEFGDDAETLFAPQAIVREGPGANVATLAKILTDRTNADNGSTNYNAGFSVLADENPTAGARIFLTDGAHNVGEYLDLHKNGPPTYVIGLGIGKDDTADGARLQRIATDTKGLYFPRVTSRRLQPIMNLIDAKLNCDIDLDSFVDTLTKEDPTPEPNEVAIEDGTYSVDVNVYWDELDDTLDLDKLELLDADGDVVHKVGRTTLRRATQFKRARQAGALTLVGARGPTFATVRLRGLDGGKTAKKIRVTVKARKVGGKNARAHTQITQSRRRK